MNRLKNCWTWLGKSRNQKTLAFVGSGLVIVAGAAWQIYPRLFGADKSNASSASNMTVNTPVSFSGPVHDPTINQPGGIINNYGIPPDEFRRPFNRLYLN